MERDQTTPQDDSELDAFPPPRFVNLGEVQPEYTNYIHVLPDQFAFHVIFAQIIPPVIRNDEDRLALLKEGFSANVVGRLIVTPKALRDFIQVLSFQLEEFEASHETDSRGDSAAEVFKEDQNGS